MKIIPIHKNGSRTAVKQYRGIAIPPTLAKIQDKLMTARLTKMIENKITVHQHGFVKKRNTNTNVLELIQHAYDAFAKNEQTDVFFADFSKAFDKVLHSKLIKKLSMLGVNKEFLIWFWSFLKNRTQITKIGNEISEEIEITSGIIQGGHSSPISFAAFTNDMQNKVRGAIIENFADDTKIYCNISKQTDTNKLQYAINDFLNWCNENKLQLNKEKCHIMTLSRKNNYLQHTYTLENEPIHRTFEHKDLGVMLDSKLKMDIHIDKQIGKARNMLALIKRAGADCFQRKTKRILYMSLVRSHLDYASIIFNPNYATATNKIESIQKQFIIHALKNEEFRDENYRLAPYQERCDKIQLENLARRRINSSIFFIYDLLENNIISSTLNNRIEIKQEPMYNLRKKDFLNIPKCNTNYLQNAPLSRMCTLFNKVADIYKSSITKDEFKKRIKEIPNSHFEL